MLSKVPASLSALGFTVRSLGCRGLELDFESFGMGFRISLGLRDEEEHWKSLPGDPCLEIMPALGLKSVNETYFGLLGYLRSC